MGSFLASFWGYFLVHILLWFKKGNFVLVRRFRISQ